jgi:DNA-binding transcriptional ArsR family regulator
LFPPDEISELQRKGAEISATLRMLSHEKRLLALCRLAIVGEMSVGVLAETAGLSQSALSQHLAKLRADGLVETRQGRTCCTTASVTRALAAFLPRFMRSTVRLQRAAPVCEHVRSLSIQWLGWVAHAKQHLDLGRYWHIIQTCVGSLILIVAALVIRFTGFLAIEPLLGIAFGPVLLWASWGILHDSVHLLIEGKLPGVALAEVAAALRSARWCAPRAPRACLGPDQRPLRVLDALRTDATIAAEDDLLVRAHDLLRARFGFFFVTLQIETTCLDEAAGVEIDITSSAPSA